MCVQGCVGDVSKAKKPHLAQERAITKFHEARITTVTEGSMASKWKSYADCVGVKVSPLLAQSVNRRVFEEVLVQQMAIHYPPKQAVATPTTEKLSSEEKNIIRYVSGFVPLKLMKKYRKVKGAKAGDFVECLSHMAVDGPESSFYDYTKEWIKLVDCGGLFNVNDNSYVFFRALELLTRSVLLRHFKSSSSSKDTLIKDIIDGDDILQLWSELSIDIPNADEANELLQHVIELWITIRGHSMGGAWMEQFKKENQKSVKKKKGLLKGIKKAAEASCAPKDD